MDGREYRRTVYTLAEITGIAERYGLPQDWNSDGQFGPERYIEVQFWDDIKGLMDFVSFRPDQSPVLGRRHL